MVLWYGSVSPIHLMHIISLSSIMCILPLSSHIHPFLAFSHNKLRPTHSLLTISILHITKVSTPHCVSRPILHAIFINPPIRPSSLTCLLPLNRAPCRSHGSLLMLQRCVPLFVHLVVSPPPVCNRRSSVYRLSVPVPTAHPIYVSATATHCLPQVSSVYCRCSMLQPHHTRASSLVTDGRCSVYMNVRESARMSKFTNDGLTPSHTTCFIAIHIILLFVVFPVVRMPAYASSLHV